MDLQTVEKKSPEVKTTRLTKTNIDQIRDDEENNYKTVEKVETEKSILDKFNDTAKRSNASMSQRSNSQMGARKND